jgi:hypothetical protein
MKTVLFFLLFLTHISVSVSQQLIWSGNGGNNDFFDESNWKVENTNNPPGTNALIPNQPINSNLIINSVSKEIFITICPLLLMKKMTFQKFLYLQIHHQECSNSL